MFTFISCQTELNSSIIFNVPNGITEPLLNGKELPLGVTL